MKATVAPCGIDCSTCPIYIATKNKDRDAAIKACKKWVDEFDSPWCDGCLANKRLWINCAECDKRKKYFSEH